MIEGAFRNGKPGAAYLNLTAGAWARLRRSWNIPVTVPLLLQAWLAGPLRSLAAAFQTLVVGASRQRIVDAEAIFILGFWRSGTSFLHELICADESFAFASTHACLHPHHFVFSEKWARGDARMRRPQDGMMTGWGTPQEDEFALLSLGARSPYEGLIAAADFAKALRLSDPCDLPAKDAARWERIFLRFLRALRFSRGGKPLVLKSPSHSYRAATLRRLVPGARFVLIVRDPYEVFESMLKTYRAYSLRYGLVPGLSNREVREIILEERLRCEEKLQSGLSGLGADRLAIVKYEDLAADPVGVVEKIYRQFGLAGFETVRPALMRRCADARPHIAAQPPAQWRARLKTAWAGIFARYGYDPER